MKQGQEVNQKNQDFVALLNQEYALVVDGKPAERLFKLFKEYQTDPFTALINLQLIQKYVNVLIINGQYLELSFLLMRSKEQKKFPQNLYKIADFGKRQELIGLWENLHKYISQVVDIKLAKRLKQGSIDSTLSILSKYFINFNVQELIKITKTTKEQFLERGADIREDFVYLKLQKIQKDCLQSKLKELAMVASKMSHFE